MSGNSVLMSRFLGKVLVGDGCWPWTGATTGKGYGRFRTGQNSFRVAHRYAYEALCGPIPDGLTLDHLKDKCTTTLCVRPDHLEPVTMRVNTLRGSGPTAVNARKTHCKNGHEYTDANTYYPAKGGRVCRRCDTIRTTARYHRRKGS